MGSGVRLLDHVHGKERVRVGRVWRQGSVHHFVEWQVGITLESDMAHAYTQGDNSGMTATDTMKNTTYVVAKRMSQRCSPEAFAIELANHFVKTYPKVSGVHVVVEQKPWKRVNIGGQDHEHGYEMGSETRIAKVYSSEGAQPIVKSGLASMPVLKTTQSGYEGYIRDQYTSLPETRERMMASSVDAEWCYQGSVKDYDAVYDSVKLALFDGFFGPPIGGVYSPSVQYTLYEMGKIAVSRWVRFRERFSRMCFERTKVG